MLPLGRFAIMRGGSCEDADAGIRSRHPGVRDFSPDNRDRNWRFDVNILHLGRVSVVATRTSAFSLSLRDDGFARFYLPMRRGAALRRRNDVQELKAGTPALVTGGYASAFEDGYCGLMASFPKDLLAEALDAFCAPSPPLQAICTGAGLDRLSGQVLALVRAMDQEPAQIVNQRRFRNAHEELLLLHLAQALTDPDGTGREPGGPRRHLDAAMDFIKAHLFDEIGPMAVAAAADCSLRNLQLLFRRESGRTITETIRDLRLQAARARFLRGRADESITQVALDCGFSHLSDFARHYRATFGERPSDTVGLSRMARQ